MENAAIASKSGGTITFYALRNKPAMSSIHNSTCGAEGGGGFIVKQVRTENVRLSKELDAVHVQRSIEKGELDARAGKWPADEAREEPESFTWNILQERGGGLEQGPPHGLALYGGRAGEAARGRGRRRVGRQAAKIGS